MIPWQAMAGFEGRLVGMRPTPTGDWTVIVQTDEGDELLVLMSDGQLAAALADDDPSLHEVWLSWLFRLRRDLGYLRAQKPLC